MIQKNIEVFIIGIECIENLCWNATKSIIDRLISCSNFTRSNAPNSAQRGHAFDSYCVFSVSSSVCQSAEHRSRLAHASVRSKLGNDISKAEFSNSLDSSK